jgi:hypothetical protein
MAKRAQRTAEEEPADEPGDVDWAPSTKRRTGSNRRDVAAWPYISVISDGKCLVVYPDDATIEVWKTESWDTVAFGFSKDRSELFLKKTTNDVGVGIRRYPKQRVSVHVALKHFGKAVQKDTVGTCTVRRQDDTFVFSIAEQVTIEAA